MLSSRPSSADPRIVPRGPPPVLVVDDDPAGAVMAAAVLAADGYDVTLESLGDAVLRCVRTDVLRLVVSEIYIPCGSGACVVTALKQERHRLPRLRVLVHTRHTAPADTAWALAAGCDGLVKRPAADGLLLREVRRLDAHAGEDRA